MLQHLYLRVTVTTILLILMFIFRSNTCGWEFIVLLLVFFKITAFTRTCIFMQSREKPNSFKWASAKCYQHQMFDVQQINTKMNQQCHSLKSSSLCASTKARTRIPISANRLTSITGRKKWFASHNTSSQFAPTQSPKPIKEQKTGHCFNQSVSLSAVPEAGEERRSEADSLNRVQFSASSQRAPYSSVWASGRGQRRETLVCVINAESSVYRFPRARRTCGLLLRHVVRSVLDSSLQAFDLLVVVGPLCHDPHRSLQLGLFGHRVVALILGKWEERQNSSYHSSHNVVW